MTFPKVNGLTPVLVTDEMEKTIKFYQEIMDFHLDFTYPNEGLVTHAGFSIGNVGEGDDHRDDEHFHFHISKTIDIVRNS